MQELIVTVPKDNRPGYLRIAEGLRQAIQAGRLKPGEKLPSSRALAERLGVHRHTVIAAMDELVAEGWLEAGERRVPRVASVLPSQFFEPKPRGKYQCLKRKITWQFARNFAESPCGPVEAKPGEFAHVFQSGQPDLRLFPYSEFRACLAESLRRSPAARAGYGTASGHAPFVARLREYLAHMRALTDREIVVTHGTQEGVFLAAQLLLKPGDKVAVEALGYGAAWDAFRTAGAELVPIRVDENGLDPEAFEAALKKHRLRLLYLTPHHQYPTTVTLPVSRRMRIYELASRHQLPVFEDDYDHEFHYRCQPIAPMAVNDPCELVIYASTLSKVMFPSMRIGFLAVPETLLKPLSNLRSIITRQNSVLMQDAVARWMDNGGFERHLRRMRRVYQERRDALVDALTLAKSAGLPLSWLMPDGGMALWLDCAVDSDAVARAAAAAGVYVTAESAYRIKSAPGTHLRLGFASQTPDEIRAGVRLLSQAVESVAGKAPAGRRRRKPAAA
ncbi:MAG TPA: PLP-dependent aminotransferase family protein [Gammaproteobacteria bacterium]|nr:PLP-dependent aminotransferase family protein [Gammaproteobacteria bacterium]